MKTEHLLERISKSPKLKTLPDALDPEKMIGYLEPMAQRFVHPKATIKKLDIEILRQRTQRCVLRYRVTLRAAGNGRTHSWRVIGKVFKPGRGEETYRVMKRIWDAGFQRGAADGISIPQPYGFFPDLWMLFQEEVRGEPFKEALQARPNDRLLRRLAEALAKFHRAPLADGPPLSLDEFLLRCHPRYPFLILALADCQPRVDYILHQARRYLASDSTISYGTIHGDFHLGQVHMHKDHIWLIDFDAICYGDPAVDVGNLMVFLKGKAKKHPELAAHLPAFLEAYLDRVDGYFLNRVLIYEALTHLRRACKLLRHQEKGWSRKIKKMLSRAIYCVDRAYEQSVTIEDVLAC